jgi:outer membrane protein W
MTRGGSERAALAMTVAWLCSTVLSPTMARAQTPATAAGNAARDAAVDFDIPAQPMAAALNSWAVQADAQIFVDPGPVAHLMAPAVKGTLTPRQALRALLGRSNLQVAQGANGVFVIKPRLAVIAAPEAAAPVGAPPESVATPPAAPPALTARDREGPWMLGLDLRYAQDSGAASGGASAAVAGEYFFTDHVAASIAVTSPRTHFFAVPDTPAPGYRATARLQSSVLGLRYYVAPEQRVRAYLGAGIDVTTLSDSNGVTGLDRVTVGPAVEAGVDISFSPHWLLDAAAGWAQVRPGVAGNPQGIRLDPVTFGLGFVYRFGR